MARHKKIGDIYRFDFDEKYHCYCQILKENDVCFFDFYSDNENDDINEILNKNEIFRIWLDRDCFKSSKWKFICNKELFDSRKNITKKYNKPIGNDYYQIYEEGKFVKATREECKGLEYTAAWTELGIIYRLNFSFFNKDIPEHMKKKLPFYE
ncbi:MAG: Imm26 family immunity protein [Treponemataceae bacterium]|nr:Imm26 family immunity protein [Treponemataceae bacterium]